MKPRFWITSTAATLGLVASAFVASDRNLVDTLAMPAPDYQESRLHHPTPVAVATVHFSSETEVQSLPGTIAPSVESDLAFRISGKLRERLFGVGDRIRAGQVIARLDDRDLRLKRESAEAELMVARTALEKARINLARIKKLQSGGWATERASDDETVAYQEALARLTRAERNATLAENMLSYAVLKADADGVVTKEFAEVGHVVTAGQPILKTAHDEAREAVVAIPEWLLADVRDRRATVELWSYNGELIDAQLRELSPIADPVTRTFEARYVLNDKKGRAQLGMSATVRLSKTRDVPTAELPLSAVLYGPDGASVWVVGADGQISSRQVSVAALGAGTVRISSGIADGEQIVALGVHKLSRGEVVVPTPKGVAR